MSDSEVRRPWYEPSAPPPPVPDWFDPTCCEYCRDVPWAEWDGDDHRHWVLSRDPEY